MNKNPINSCNIYYRLTEERIIEREKPKEQTDINQGNITILRAGNKRSDQN